MCYNTLVPGGAPPQVSKFTQIGTREMIKALVVLALIAYACWLFWRARGFAKKEFIDPKWGCELQRDYIVRRKAVVYHDATAYLMLAIAAVVALYIKI